MFDRALGLTLIVSALAACSAGDAARDERSGSTTQAIIAGQESHADQDAVVLLFQSARNQTCTGTMIAPNLLVTARHCVGEAKADGTVVDHAASDLRVYTGPAALVALREREGEPTTLGQKLVVATSRGLYPDIAFVVLEDSLSTPVAAMRLARGVGVGEKLGVIGYGLDESGTRPAQRMQRGGLVVSLVGPGRSQIGERIERGEIVFGEAACSGDSGGPAFSTTTGALVAIASRVGNGTLPNDRSPASFCVGDNTNDVYTDFTPVADLATKAFAAAGATPVLEDSVAPAKEGELANATLDGANEAQRVSGDVANAGGCSAAPRAGHAAPRTSPPVILLGFVAAFGVLMDRRRTTRR